MSQKLDFTVPFNDLLQYVPQNLRNPAIKGLIDNLFNRFMTHDESIPLYGYVGRKPTAPDDKTTRVPQATVERDVNAITPVLSFRVGSETQAFTVQDIIKKANVLGVRSDNQDWLYAQANNFLPPIDIDRFANFYNYYWVAKALPTKPVLAWNSTLAPEYYTIAKPQAHDVDKMNVVTTTTEPIVLTGSGFDDQYFTLTFTSPTEFTITPGNGLNGYTALPFTGVLSSSLTSEDTFHFRVTKDGGATSKTLVSFTIARDPVYDNRGVLTEYETFEAGDKFVIDTTFLSATYNVSFVGGLGVKGKVKNVVALSTYQTVGGVTVQPGQRVLVRHNGAANGIYTVGPQAWTRASDFDGSTTAEARVWISAGQLEGHLFEHSNGAWNDRGVQPSNTNDWQESNHWVHINDLSAMNLAKSGVVQAVRPIIEYSANLQLNSFVRNGAPAESGTPFTQRKTEFNQLPFFDLFRYDGTHAKLASSIFYYEEDLTQELDLDLQKRVKLSSTDSLDYVFNHGLVDENNNLLFYKLKNGELKTIWHAGYDEAKIVDPVFIGVGTGTLTDIEAEASAQQQVWILRATSPTTFSVEGSKFSTLPSNVSTISVGVPYSNADFSCLIQAGSTPFAVDDTFLFRIGNLETPRYSRRDDENNIVDVYGGPAVSADGAYQVSRAFIHNPYNESRGEVLEGTLYSHFRSILGNQLEDAPRNHAFGGIIKNWSTQQTLLAALLMQRDLTPISMINLAERQYEAGLNAIVDIYKQTIVQYLTTNGAIVPASSTFTERLDRLLDSILEQRARDHDVRTVLFDTTSGVVGIPATLPQLGIIHRVEPKIGFDNLLGINVLTHHDGHGSSLHVDNVEFRRSILNNVADIEVLRSDGTKTAAIGSFNTTAPVRPYRGQLWIRPDGTESDVLIFDVDYDDEAPTTATVGQTWFNRTAGAAGVLSVWDGVQWVAQSSQAGAWKVVNLAEVLNQLLLRVEQRLFDNVNPNRQVVSFSHYLSNERFTKQLERELFEFAGANGLSPLGSDFVLTNPMTWNYSLAYTPDVAQLSTPVVPARWHNMLIAHQVTVPGVLYTTRPNREPWRLLGFADFGSWWSSLTSEQQTAYAPYATPDELVTNTAFTPAGYVRVVSTVANTTLLSGLQTIDGVALSSGDVVLLQNESGAENNGLWTARAGAWTRAATPLLQNSYVSVLEGSRKGTIWVLTNDVAAVGTTPVRFEQARYWSNRLWEDVQAARPTLRLSVDTDRDELLPPYVSPSSSQAANALTNAIPSGIALPYEFGDGGPVETVWYSSAEFGYGLARALFRHDPLKFLEVCWGFNWVKVDGIRYDGYDLNSPGHKRFMLHGDLIQAIPRSEAALTVGPTSEAFSLTFTAVEVDGDTYHQSFTVRNAANEVVGYVREGQETTLNDMPSVLIEDGGRPFRIGDRFNVSTSGDVTFVAAARHSFVGFGQIFANALRTTSVNTTDGFAISAYRNWDVRMGYRAGGLVATDDLLVRTDNDTLSSSSYELLLKKNELAKDMWVQALRVTVEVFGEAVPKPAGSSTFVPSTDASDWTFLVEGYNPRYLNISYYDVDTAGEFQTFNVLDRSSTETTWKQFTGNAGVISTDLPLRINGLQNLVNFLFGYSRYLEDAGWVFNSSQSPGSNVDAQTGRARTWQLEIEKVIDQVYRGLEVDQGHVVNPFMDELRVAQPAGMLSSFADTPLFDTTVHPGVFDIAGVRMKDEDLFLIRGLQESTFSAAAPIYSAHAQLTEYEHLFIFNHFVESSIRNGLLYDPFSGARVVTYKFNGRRQAGQTFRPEFGGHYLAGNQVRQNLQASTDNIQNFYDANRAFENDQTTRHSLALLGFSTKQYFDDLDITDKSQFNFWRGLIQAKGTNLSVDAYLNNNRFESAEIDEYWAYKVAEFGDARQRAFPELKLSVDDSVQQFTQLQFDYDPATASAPLPNFTQISRFDENRWFSIDDLNQDTYFKAEQVGSYSAVVEDGDIVHLPFIADKLEFGSTSTATVTQVNATTLRVTGNGPLVVSGFGPATPRYNPVKLFNYVDNELVEEIPLWHPAIGQHTPIALESINIISGQNPARYNVSTKTTNNAAYDPLRPWGSNEIGRVWFDTSNLAYIPYYDETVFPNRAERLSRWGALADYGSIDVYEWVQSTVPPSEYNALAAEQAGNADLDTATKAAGEVALQKLFKRDRLWSVRPIAWSRAGVPLEAAHPSFNSSFDSILYRTGTTISLERGLFSDYNIVEGSRVGAWFVGANESKPMNELIVTNRFTKSVINVSTQGPFTPLTSTVGAPVLVNVAATAHTKLVGPLFFSVEPTPSIQRSDVEGGLINQWDTSLQLTVTAIDSGDYEIVSLGVASGFQGPIAEVPATTGYQIAGFGPVKTGTDETGLEPGVIYTASVEFNGATPIELNIDGADAGTFAALVTEMNAQLPGAPVRMNEAGDIVIVSPMTGSTSTVEITDVSLFSSINDFDYIQLAVAGADAVPAVPAPYLYGATTTLSAGEIFRFELPTFGLLITATALADGTYPADTLLNAIVDALDDKVGVRDAVEVIELVPASSEVPDPSVLSNDPDDPEYAVNNGIGWRAWTVPTQEELTADGRQPNSVWKPYVGDFSIPAVMPVETIQNAVAYNKNPLKLNDGTVIERYKSTWLDWETMENTVLTATQTGVDSVTLTNTERVDELFTSVYVNGIAQLKASYTVVGNTVTVYNVSYGSTVTVIIRPYHPTNEELAFDPSVAENLSFQTQYKLDYEYVSRSTRDIEGSPAAPLYYFWVKNKSTAAVGKRLSVQAIKQELSTGPANFLTFQNFLPASGSLPNRYDAITISGLSYIIAKDNTFKLRFTRNFTLRDDPEQLDLKDSHTEWSLIRPAQRTKIPEKLWLRLVDSVAGQDAAGNAVPALRRVLYDERNGTTTRFGFDREQALAPQVLLVSSIIDTILNTKLINKNVPASSEGVYPPDFIEFLNFDESERWFATPAAARQTMTDIWTKAKVSQINEIFFAVLNDILASNYQMTDIFKTSRLSAYSIKVVAPTTALPTYE